MKHKKIKGSQNVNFGTKIFLVKSGLPYLFTVYIKTKRVKY